MNAESMSKDAPVPLVLEIDEVSKSFPGLTAPVLEIERFTVEAGAQVALRGRSGSGKTTLLHLIAGLMLPDSGSIVVAGQNLFHWSESRRDRFRGANLGYVFQSFNLLQGMTVWENLWLAAALAGKVDESRLQAFLRRLDLEGRRDHFPYQLSLGQQQRVAVARALVHSPRLVLADEPTGNLDPLLAEQALELMREMCSECGAALLIVSHDPAILARFEDCRDLAEINTQAVAPC